MCIRVVLAEESDLLRRMLTQFLKNDAEIELVGVAAGVPEILHIVRESRPHVLLFDLHMAVRHEDRCGDFKTLSEHVALIAISLDVGEEASELAERCGAARLIDKMKLHSHLVSAILSSVNGKTKHLN